MSYEIIRSTIDRSKLIELGHMIRGTYPTKTKAAAAKTKEKPTLKLKSWRTKTRTKSASSLNADPVKYYQDSQRAMKLREFAKIIRGF